MAHLKLYRKPGKKYKTELRPSRIDILLLPLVVCFLLSIVVWSYVTGHSRPVEAETQAPAVETSLPAEEETTTEAEAQPADV